MHAEKDFQFSVRLGRANRDSLATKGFAEREHFTAIADRCIDRYLSHSVGRVVLPFGQYFGECSWAHAISICGDFHAQRLVRPLVVVDVPPRIKPPLADSQVRPPLTLDQLHVKRSVKSFIFSLGLRMKSSAVTDGDSQLEQPNRQPRPLGLSATCTPRGAVVAENA